MAITVSNKPPLRRRNGPSAPIGRTRIAFEWTVCAFAIVIASIDAVAAEGTNSETSGPRPTHEHSALAPLLRDPFWPAPPIATKVPVAARPAPISAPPPATPLAPPSAPSFPYRYLGSYVEQSKEQVIFLMKGDDVISARAGQRLDNGYTLESISDLRATFTHPLLDHSYVLLLGGSGTSP